MEDHGLVALFVTDPGNLFYFTGFPFSAERSFPRPVVFLLPREGNGVLVAHDFHFPFPWRGDLRLYQEVGRLPIELLTALFTEKECERGDVGAELGFEQQVAASPRDFDALDKQLDGARLVDASALLWQLRMTKTAAEVENITRACQVSDEIFRTCFDALKEGMTTRELDYAFQHEALVAGARASGAIICIGAFEPSQAAGSSAPDRALARGEMCWVDLSLGWNGYRTDYCRAVVCGGPSDKQKREWQQMHDVLLAGKQAARPGQPVSDICRAQLNKAQDLGLDMSSWTARRFGHGSGIHTTEPPYVSLNDHTLLAPNMVIHLEPGLIGDDGIYVREEMIVITENGCEALSRAPWELGSV